MKIFRFLTIIAGRRRCWRQCSYPTSCSVDISGSSRRRRRWGLRRGARRRREDERRRRRRRGSGSEGLIRLPKTPTLDACLNKKAPSIPVPPSRQLHHFISSQFLAFCSLHSHVHLNPSTEALRRDTRNVCTYLYTVCSCVPLGDNKAPTPAPTSPFHPPHAESQGRYC